MMVPPWGRFHVLAGRFRGPAVSISWYLGYAGGLLLLPTVSPLVGFGRMVALYHRSSALYHMH
jgi:hypothetical protein